ncbi:hypothetical protein B0H16DRAFT_270363 [Mycena metata]|uniref:CBM1 domain-containing protein n=1 Tax=Mycena metata TaxID=1033252 RepID=A0AAD7HQW1_9AGAR|nr:hypothetical protein B0H16DRAFT_270363 [Mycena metata]
MQSLVQSVLILNPPSLQLQRNVPPPDSRSVHYHPSGFDRRSCARHRCAHRASCVPATGPLEPIQTEYGQCGGTGWEGPTVCKSPSICQAVVSPYYYQCLLDDQSLTTTAPLATATSS